ncbi:MAG: Asp-tRNA(Asn)/Glu-tRNA(Gln) amidotransferase subunit GatA [Patescibacteria group bacterium]
MNLNELTIKEARIKLDSGEISSLELAKACLLQIKKLNPEINAVLTACEDSAVSDAKEADKRIKSGETGDLLGIPYLCKDNIMTKGIKTTAASKILENYIAPYDATIIKKLKEAGAVLLGKTNMDEFAHGASTENSAYGATKNPLDLTRVPGGSSGGSAAALVSNMCIFAIGSDTGGSIRQPASFCGIYGLKPGYGRVSRFGLLSMTSSTDVIGSLTKNAYDSALVLKVIAGRDDLDATSSPEAVEVYEEKINSVNLKVAGPHPLKGIKVGLPKEYFLKEMNKEISLRLEETIKKLEYFGAEMVKVSLPNTEYGVPVYYIITPSEISSNLARFDGIGWGLAKNEAKDLQDFYKTNRGLGFGQEVKRRIMLGTYALSAGYYDAYYKKAQSVRTLIVNDFNKVFEKVDILLTPTSPHSAFKIGEQINDPLAMYMEDIFVTGASLAGLPALSVPIGLVKTREGNDMPVGAQLIAPRLEEGTIFKVAGVLEK